MPPVSPPSITSRDEPSAATASPQQPWLHDLAIAVDGPLTSLSARDGDMSTGAEGVYFDDTRVVSRLTVEIDGGLSQVADASSGHLSEFLSSARRLGDEGADPSVEVHRRRALESPRFMETFTVRSRAARPVTATLGISLACDGLDMADVKHGSPAGPGRAMDVSNHEVRWQAAELDVTGTWSSAPTCIDSSENIQRFAFVIDLEPGASTCVSFTATITRRTSSLLDADAGSNGLHYTRTVRAHSDDPRVAKAVTAALHDAEHLALRDPEAPQDIFLAAGTPWYLTLFGRDSLWAARMLLPLGTNLALGTLRTLARRQGTTYDAAIAEAPGKIPHEVRRGAAHAAYELPPVYYGTVDATALWVCLLGEALDWGLAPEDASALLPNLRAALGWLTTDAAPDADGLVKYIDETGGGLVNQGWKDSGDSIRFRDGAIARSPIALIEAQAYAVQACRAGARILGALGSSDDASLIAAAERQAETLTRAVRERFWVREGEQTWPAIALDGHDDPVTGIASNMGHCLGTGIFDADESRIVARTLTAPNMLGEYGIRTFANDNGGYNPIGYHTGSVWIHDTAICAMGLAHDGFAEEAGRVALTMLATSEFFGYRSPELHGDHGVLGRPIPYPASCRPQAWSAAATIGMLTAALGLSCDASASRLCVREGASPFGALTLTGLRVADHEVTLMVAADGTATAEGLPDGWRLERVR